MPRLGSILVIRLSSLGDVLFALPAVEALLRSGVAERVSWLVEDRAAPLLAGVGGLDEVVVFPRSTPAGWPRHARALRRRRDDVVLDLQCNLKSRLQRMALRAPRKIGFDAPIAREGAERGLTERIHPPPACRHRVAMNLAVLRAVGVAVPARPPRPALGLAERSRERAAELLGPHRDGPAVVLHPGTSAFGDLKRWPAGRFAALGRALVARHGAEVLVTAGPGEERLAAEVVSGVPGRARLVPPTGLPDLAALLAAADLCVAADSMPLHLANALGTPVVGLYGPKDPAVTGPFFDRAEVVRSGVACSPCTLRRCADRLCMERLEVAPVLAAVAQLLAAPHPAPPASPPVLRPAGC